MAYTFKKCFRGFQKKYLHGRYGRTNRLTGMIQATISLGDQANLEVNFLLNLFPPSKRNDLLPLFAIHNSTHLGDDELPLAGRGGVDNNI